MKIVRIRSFSGLHFPALEQNTERYREFPYFVQMWENAHQSNSDCGQLSRSYYYDTLVPVWRPRKSILNWVFKPSFSRTRIVFHRIAKNSTRSLRQRIAKLTHSIPIFSCTAMLSDILQHSLNTRMHCNIWEHWRKVVLTYQ